RLVLIIPLSRDSHGHLTIFHLGLRLDVDALWDESDHLVHDLLTLLGMCLLTTLELDRKENLVTFGQKLLDLLRLHLEIMVRDARSQPDLFHFDSRLLLLR